jgi:hypothetical protein
MKDNDVRIIKNSKYDNDITLIIDHLDIDDDEPEDLEYKNEYEQEYMVETSDLIREKIFEYVDKNGYELCEFLDNINVENYVSWLLGNK